MDTARCVRSLRTRLGPYLQRDGRVPPFFIVLMVAALAGVLLVPRAFGKRGPAQVFELVFVTSAYSVIRTAAHTQVPADAPPFHGDVVYYVFDVYPPDVTSGTPIGKYFITGVGTARPEEFGTAGNHVLTFGRIELFGQGSLDGIATVAFGKTTYASILGGTGVYADASGQCIGTPHGPNNQTRLTCDIR